MLPEANWIKQQYVEAAPDTSEQAARWLADHVFKEIVDEVGRTFASKVKFLTYTQIPSGSKRCCWSCSATPSSTLAGVEKYGCV